MARRQTTHAFVTRAQEIHGDRYDYSRARYVNSKVPVDIVCPVHGLFRCSPANHLRPVDPRGCPACGRERQRLLAAKPFSRFLAEAQSIHGERYAYESGSYAGARTNMTIICPDHGPFPQSPSAHLTGHGCPICAAKGRADKHRRAHADSVAARILQASSGTVRLDEESYVRQFAEADFVCDQHGGFRRVVIKALIGDHPCVDCARTLFHRFPKDAEALATAIREKLGSSYDVQVVEFIGRGSEVELWCGRGDHAPCRRAVATIRTVRGCPCCAQEIATERRLDAVLRRTASLREANEASRSDRHEAWLAAAYEIHGDQYDYGRVDYRTARQKVEIVCPVHGVFLQTPADHLAGGCRRCADADLKGLYSERYFAAHPEAGNRPGALYYLRMRYGGVTFYKVGITINNVESRHAMLKTLPGLDHSVLAEAPMTIREAFEAEQEIQRAHGNGARLKIPIDKASLRRIRIGPSECFSRPLSGEQLERYFIK